MSEAITGCEIFGCPDNLTTGQDILSGGVSLIEYAMVLIFPGLIIFGIFIIIRAAVKMITSQGDESKIQESAKMIKGVFIGIIILFVGIVGMVLFLAFFQASPSQIDLNKPEALESIDIPFI